MTARFRPDLFSDPTVYRTPVEADERAELAAVWGEHFAHLGPLDGAVERLGGLGVNSSNHRVAAGDRAFLLKRIPVAEAAALRTQVAFANRLGDEGLPVPRTQRDAAGEFVTSAGDAAWTVQSFTDGQHFAGELDELEPTARLVGRLAAACDRSPSRLAPSKQIPLVGDEERATFAALDARSGDVSDLLEEALAEPLRRGWADVAETLEASLALTAQLAPAAIVHIDLHPHNLLIRDAEPVAILDHASFCLASVPVMVAYAAHKLLRQVVCAQRSGQGTVGDDATSIRPLVDRFVRSLGEECSEVSPLAGERAHIGELARAEITRRLFIALDLVLRDDRRWAHVIPMHLDALEESRLLFGSAG